MTRLRLFAAAAAVFLCTAADWPQFLGPTAQRRLNRDRPNGDMAEEGTAGRLGKRRR